MGKTRVLGLAGLFVAGVALTGCQSSPRTTPVASSGSTTWPATAQGWDNKQTPTNPASAGGSAGLAARTGTTGASTSTFDANGLPRTSQEMVPRTMGNQVSSYTTDPSMATGPGAAPIDPPPAPMPPANAFGQAPRGAPAVPGGTGPGVNGVQPMVLNGPGPVVPTPGSANPGAPAQPPATSANFPVAPAPVPTIGHNAPDGLPRDPFEQPVGAVMPPASPPPGLH